MLGPIDFIIVGFEGNKFDGSVLKALTDEIDKGIIRLIDLAVISKDSEGDVATVNLSDYGDKFVVKFYESYASGEKVIADDDIQETADLLENDTAAGLLVIEHLWAKPLKKALLDAGGVLISEGRIHPDAAQELTVENRGD